MARGLLSSARHALVVRLQLHDEPAFERWASENFDWGPESARVVAAIGERFAARLGDAVDQFQPGALLLLAGADAVEAAARARTRITVAVAKRLLAGEDP